MVLFGLPHTPPPPPPAAPAHFYRWRCTHDTAIYHTRCHTALTRRAGARALPARVSPADRISPVVDLPHTRTRTTPRLRCCCAGGLGLRFRTYRTCPHPPPPAHLTRPTSLPYARARTCSVCAPYHRYTPLPDYRRLRRTAGCARLPVPYPHSTHTPRSYARCAHTVTRLFRAFPSRAGFRCGGCGSVATCTFGSTAAFSPFTCLNVVPLVLYLWACARYASLLRGPFPHYQHLHATIRA